MTTTLTVEIQEKDSQFIENVIQSFIEKWITQEEFEDFLLWREIKQSIQESDKKYVDGEDFLRELWR